MDNTFDLDKKMKKFMDYCKEYSNSEKYPQPEKIKISTNSASAKLTKPIDLKELSDILIDILKKNNKDVSFPIKYIKYKDIIAGNYQKKQNKRKKTVKETNKHFVYNKFNNFYNQLTVKIIPESYKNRYINLKLFTNGSISMTGCPTEESGVEAINILLKYSGYDEIDIDFFQISLINSDYNANFKINRYKLYDICKTKYNLCTKFDPESYNAVKISFMWNNNKSFQDGICNCSNVCICGGKKRCKCAEKCNGKKTKNGVLGGYGDKNCKKITIAIAENGKIIITGSQENKQLIDTYDFINMLLKDNYVNLVRFSILDFDEKKENNILEYFKK